GGAVGRFAHGERMKPAIQTMPGDQRPDTRRQASGNGLRLERDDVAEARQMLHQIAFRIRIEIGNHDHRRLHSLRSELLRGGDGFRSNGSHGDDRDIAAGGYHLNAGQLKASVETRNESAIIFAEAVVNGSGKGGGLAESGSSLTRIG